MISVATETTASRRETYPNLVERLSELSVKKHYEAYRDVPWDGPDARIDRHDPRFHLNDQDPLYATEWYQGLRPEQRSSFALEMICEKLKIGLEFESLLSIGLLEFTHRLPNGSPEFRYALHEVIEESQHSLMFQQFINQAGIDPRGLAPAEMSIGRRIARYGGSFPELFFFFVLAGEIFIDRDNRDRMRERDSLHPIFRKLLQIHITEEARHVCFAERYLQENLPKLSWWRTMRVRWAVPRVLREGERLMLIPSQALARKYGIPRATMKAVFGPGTPHAARVREIVRPVYALLKPQPT